MTGRCRPRRDCSPWILAPAHDDTQDNIHPRPLRYEPAASWPSQRSIRYNLAPSEAFRHRFHPIHGHQLEHKRKHTVCPPELPPSHRFLWFPSTSCRYLTHSFDLQISPPLPFNWDPYTRKSVQPAEPTDIPHHFHPSPVILQYSKTDFRLRCSFTETHGCHSRRRPRRQNEWNPSLVFIIFVGRLAARCDQGLGTEVSPT